VEQLLHWDSVILYYINTLGANSWFDVFFPAITDLHKTWLFNIIVIPLFIGLFYWKFRAKGFLVFLGLLLCLGFADFAGNQIKHRVQRPRPPDTAGVEVTVRSTYGGYSFVSNHATNMFALATYATRFIPVVGWVVFPLAVLVSYSRIYNGVHFPLDVLAGALLGSFCGFVFSVLFKKLLHRLHRSGKT
jgi:undecaprenyl-diphosphatase